METMAESNESLQAGTGDDVDAVAAPLTSENSAPLFDDISHVTSLDDLMSKISAMDSDEDDELMPDFRIPSRGTSGRLSVAGC